MSEARNGSDRRPSGAVHSRRSFLGAAAGVAGAAAVGSSVSGMPLPRLIARPGLDTGNRLRDGEELRLAVIGTGGMGTGHAEAFSTMAMRATSGTAEEQGRFTSALNTRVVALADVCDSHLARCKAKVEDIQGGTVAGYRYYKDMLAKEKLHGVVVASPEHWHAQHAIDCLLAGLDVYCEKPMTYDLKDGVQLFKVCKDNPQRILQVGTQMTQLPKYAEARKMIAQGVIGRPTSSQTSYCRNSKEGEWLYYAIDPAWNPGVNLDWREWCRPFGEELPWNPEHFARWRRYKKFSTGIIGDLLVHQVTPLLYAIGDVGWPTRVVASGAHIVDKKMENFDQVNLVIEFENDHIMTVAGSTCNEVGVENLIRGHQGNIFLNSRHCVMRPERIFSEEIDATTVECPDIGNDQDVHRLRFLEAIRTRQPHFSDVELGLKIMVIVDLAARSMWEGSAMRFDPKTMEAKADRQW